MRLSEKCKKPQILTILTQSGQFWTGFGPKWPFLVFLEKQKRLFFTLPKTSLHAKNQGNPMCGFLEKRLHGKETDREREKERERDEAVFNGPNCPVGVGPKIGQFR